MLLAAFLVRLPIIRDAPVGRELAALSKTVIGQAPLALGIGPVDVFNARDWDVNSLSLAIAWADDERIIGATDPSAPAVTTRRTRPDLAEHIRSLRRDGLWCADVRHGTYLADVLRPHAPRPGLILRLRYEARVLPSADDLWAGRYVPPRSVPVCDVIVEADTGHITYLAYTGEGETLLGRR